MTSRHVKYFIVMHGFRFSWSKPFLIITWIIIYDQNQTTANNGNSSRGGKPVNMEMNVVLGNTHTHTRTHTLLHRKLKWRFRLNGFATQRSAVQFEIAITLKSLLKMLHSIGFVSIVRKFLCLFLHLLLLLLVTMLSRAEYFGWRRVWTEKLLAETETL